MRTMTGLKLRTLVLMGFGMAIGLSGPAAAESTPTPPDAVNKTLKARFPEAKVEHADSEVEDGVTVYSFEFMSGGMSRATDIAADGTMLEIATAIQKKDVPEAAMNSILKEAPGAEIVEVDRVEITHETRDGYVYKLPATVTQYEVEIKKGDAMGEMVVGGDGKVLEPAKWDKK